MTESAGGVRHSILDMAPLELDCMNALWPRGEATVRDVRLALAESRPRAYTTIMTILDRLAQKKVVSRRKVGRAWVYRPNISIEDARSHAVCQLVDGFFDGSEQALAAHLLTNHTQSSDIAKDSGTATAASPMQVVEQAVPGARNGGLS
jgi:BlaI family penicillinase repressor